jgi:hypothetical protein
VPEGPSLTIALAYLEVLRRDPANRRMLHVHTIERGLMLGHFTYEELTTTVEELKRLRRAAAVSEAQDLVRQMLLGHSVVVSLLDLIRDEGVRLPDLGLNEDQLAWHLRRWLSALPDPTT